MRTIKTIGDLAKFAEENKEKGYITIVDGDRREARAEKEDNEQH